jgi:hypothetical protein
MSSSLYYVDLFYTRQGDSDPAWHRTEGTLSEIDLSYRTS